MNIPVSMTTTSFPVIQNIITDFSFVDACKCKGNKLCGTNSSNTGANTSNAGTNSSNTGTNTSNTGTSTSNTGANTNIVD